MSRGAGLVAVEPVPFDERDAVQGRALPRAALEQHPALQAAPHDHVAEAAGVERHEAEGIEMVEHADGRPAVGGGGEVGHGLGAVHLDHERVEMVAALGFEEFGEVTHLPTLAPVEHESVRRIERQAPAAIRIAGPEAVQPQRQGLHVVEARRTPDGAALARAEMSRKAAVLRQVEEHIFADAERLGGAQ